MYIIKTYRKALGRQVAEAMYSLHYKNNESVHREGRGGRQG